MHLCSKSSLSLVYTSPIIGGKQSYLNLRNGSLTALASALTEEEEEEEAQVQATAIFH